MTRKRKVYAPFSLTSEAGVAQTPVEGYIDVKQEIHPIVNTGTIDEKGTWTGIRSNDTEFIGLQPHEAIADGSPLLTDDIDMRGYRDIILAANCDGQGTISMKAISPEGAFANLAPIQTTDAIKVFRNSTTAAVVLDDSSEVQRDDWTLWYVQDSLRNQIFRWQITNGIGSTRNFITAYMRIV
jgi:hypothetical protein